MAESLEGLAKFRKRLDAMTDTRKRLGTIGLLAVREAKLIVPHKTRNLSRTIRLGTVTEDYADVLAGGRLNVGYAAAVEFGTKAHDIVPRRRKALRWAAGAAGRRLTGSPRVGAAVIFARRVRHPGTRKQPYLVPGIHNALRKAGIKVFIRDPWNRAA